MKEKKAIAVGYSFGMSPEILASAKGLLVDRLISIAKEHDITVVNNADLAETLSLMKVGDMIPENLFRVMSEVLAYCYRVNEKFRKKMLNSGL